MVDLFSFSSLKGSYLAIYQALTEMRELFHQTGRLDDSNAKLDEITKLIAMYLAYRRGWVTSFPILETVTTQKIIRELQEGFYLTLQLPQYQNQDGTSIFGQKPSLFLREGDEVLTKSLIRLVCHAVDAALTNKNLDRPFDVLNEAFGHFIRDNFRSNIEDAQYMTPPEVVEFMVSMAIGDLQKDMVFLDGHEEFIVADPTCGVGSFLTAFYHKTHTLPAFSEKPIHLVGQDKVERMIRLTKINLALFEAAKYQITVGNSLASISSLSNLNGKVDLILTNPPFGARFDRETIASFGQKNLPVFATMSHSLQTVDSELLFIDRNLALLKEGGRLLIIVPDSVISAKGLPALLRQKLKTKTTLRAVVELPSVAFAQAGTRTRTSILYLIKGEPSIYPKTVFVAKSESLGFEVSSRKGVQIKTPKGINDLPDILGSFQTFQSNYQSTKPQILLDSPSCVKVNYKEFLHNSWTPNHYHVSRFKAVNSFENTVDIESVRLSEIVTFHSENRKNQPFSEGSLFISVLHIIGEGLLDVTGIKNYRPKTPGVQIYPDEILLSKINPRIPRIFVVPYLGEKMLCSSEFEVMVPKNGIDPYLIAYLLLSAPVGNQIKSLTSGTSASHNRIKTQDLSKVLLPLPKPQTAYEAKLNCLIQEYKLTIQLLVNQTIELANIRMQEQPLLTNS